MAKVNPLSKIPPQQMLFLLKQFYIQQRAENHVSIDFLPYTSQIKWITAEMLKKFPKSPWTDKLVHRTLLRLRKGDLMEKNEQTETVPVFEADDDTVENGTSKPAGEFKPEDNEDDDQ